jgi:hypothetical protein
MMRPKSANRVSTDDVRTLGGREIVLNRLVNHYKALSNVKSVIQIKPVKLNTSNAKIQNKSKFFFN